MPPSEQRTHFDAYFEVQYRGPNTGLAGSQVMKAADWITAVTKIYAKETALQIRDDYELVYKHVRILYVTEKEVVE